VKFECKVVHCHLLQLLFNSYHDSILWPLPHWWYWDEGRLALEPFISRSISRTSESLVQFRAKSPLYVCMYVCILSIPDLLNSATSFKSRDGKSLSQILSLMSVLYVCSMYSWLVTREIDMHVTPPILSRLQAQLFCRLIYLFTACTCFSWSWHDTLRWESLISKFKSLF
jgi:hypothetical protein